MRILRHPLFIPSLEFKLALTPFKHKILVYI